MRRTSLVTLISLIALIAAVAIAGCSSAPPETPRASAIDAAIATASTAVGQASTYVTSLKQPIADAPPNTAMEQLQTTLNAASSAESEVAQRQLAQEAVTQFDAIIAAANQELATVPAGSPEQQEIEQLISTLETGRDALVTALR